MDGIRGPAPPPWKSTMKTPTGFEMDVGAHDRRLLHSKYNMKFNVMVYDI